MPLLNRAIEWTSHAGRLRYVHCTLARHARHEPEFLWATAVHAVDTLRHIAGQVVAFDVRTLKAPSGATTWYALDLQFENGISGRVDVLPSAGMVEETYELFGDGFRASVTCPFGPQLGWRCFRDGRLVEAETEPAGMPEDIVNGCYDEAAAFIQGPKRRHSKALDCRSLSFGRTLLRDRSDRERGRGSLTQVCGEIDSSRQPSNALSPAVIVLSLEFHRD